MARAKCTLGLVAPTRAEHVALTAAAYAMGTFPSAVLVGRAAGRDPLAEGSGNPGASNVYRLAGRRAGAIVLVIDGAKGALATAAGRVVGGRRLALACGTAAVVGHCYPVTRQLRGGKGVATAAGMALVAEPAVAVVAGSLWAALARVTRTASLASLAAVIALPAGMGFRRRPPGEILTMTAVAALIVSRHADNLARLMRGDERSLP